MIEASHSEKNLIIIDEKRSIAKNVHDLIENGDIIFDIWPATMDLYRYLFGERKLDNVVGLCLALRESRISQIMT